MLIAGYILVGLVLLVFAGEALVKGAVSLADQLGVSRVVIGLTIVALGTSAPELVVSISSAIRGYHDIALGNIIGSNIANIGLILGISTLIFPVAVASQTIRRELPMLMLVTLSFAGLCYLGHITKLYGAILVGVLLTYTAVVIMVARKHKAAAKGAENDIPDDITHSMPKAIAQTTGGIIFLALGAEILVKGAVMLAEGYAIPQSIIGVTILAVGSSLPEMATCFSAALRKHGDIVVGNVVGSNLLNILFAISIPASIAGIQVSDVFLKTDVPMMITMTIVMGLIMLMHKRVGRVSGGLFFAAYIVYISLLVGQL